MNVILSIIQVLLAAHTAVGAFWKFSNAAYLDPMFPMIPTVGWMVISALEIVAAVLLVIPVFKRPLGKLAVIGSAAVAIEMLLFTAAFLSTGTANYGPIYYWLAVALVAAFVAYKRFTSSSASLVVGS